MCIYRYWLWQFSCLFIWTKLYVWTFKRFFKTNNVSIVAWKACIMFIFSLYSLGSEDTCYWCYFGENQCIPASDVLLKRMCLSRTAVLLSQGGKPLWFLLESRSITTLKQFLILGRCFMICPALPCFFLIIFHSEGYIFQPDKIKLLYAWCWYIFNPNHTQKAALLVSFLFHSLDNF